MATPWYARSWSPELPTTQVTRANTVTIRSKRSTSSPKVITNTLEGRLGSDHVVVEFGNGARAIFDKVEHVQISRLRHLLQPGMVARYWFEEIAGVSCDAGDRPKVPLSQPGAPQQPAGDLLPELARPPIPHGRPSAPGQGVRVTSRWPSATPGPSLVGIDLAFYDPGRCWQKLEWLHKGSHHPAGPAC